MADRIIVPTDFQDWPMVADLVPDMKLIARELSCNRFISACGCYRLPVAMFAASLGLRHENVEDALDELERRALIEQDKQTGEILILAWWRAHKCDSRLQKMQAERALARIQSKRLKELAAGALEEARTLRDMGYRTIVPTNYQEWPLVSDLVPDMKLIARELWCNRFISACGCYQLPVAMFAASLGFRRENVEDALDELERRRLIARDSDTAEILIYAWFRFHKCVSVAQKHLVARALAAIQSEKLRGLTIEALTLAGISLFRENNNLHTNHNPKPNQNFKTTTRQRRFGENNGLDGLEVEPCLDPFLLTLSLPPDLCQKARQQLIDEVAATVQMGAVRKTPAALLRRLVKLHEAGSFCPELAHKVAVDRERRKQSAAILAARTTPADQSPTACPSPPVGDLIEFFKAAGIMLRRGPLRT